MYNLLVGDRSINSTSRKTWLKPCSAANLTGSLYNTLPSVEEADGAVKVGSHFSDFVSEASKIFRSHQMETRFGLALLHTHNELEPGEWMVESQMRSRDRDALVTRPLRELKSGEACPVVWRTGEDEFIPLEFSTDPLARNLFSDDLARTRFLSDFRKLTVQSPIGKHLGLAVVHREFYKSAGPDQAPVEFTDREKRSNVVLLCSPGELTEHPLIETAWTFESAAGELNCASSCRKQCWAEDPHKKVHNQHHIPQPA